jgi:hypothetical protein
MGGVSIVTALFEGDAAVAVLESGNGFLRLRVGRVASDGLAFVTLVADTGAHFTFPVRVPLRSSGEVQTIVPTSGQTGTVVTIFGERLLGGALSLASLRFSSAPARVREANDSRVVAQLLSAAPAGIGDVVLESVSGSIVREADGFDHLADGLIAAIAPTSGAIGAEILVVGIDLFGHGSRVVNATLNGHEALILVQDNSFLRLRVVQGSGSGPIVLESDTESTVSGADFSFANSASILQIIPDRGQGGMLVTLVGTDLLMGGRSVSQLLFADVPATPLFQNNSIIVARLGVGPEVETLGGVFLQVDTDAFVSLEDVFTYVAPIDIDIVNPSTGFTGTLVTITGSSLLAGGNSTNRIEAVQLAGVAANVLSATDNQIVVEARPGPAGIGDVTIRLIDGVVDVQRNAFRYLQAPLLVSLEPNQFQLGTRVTIQGLRLLAGGNSFADFLLGATAVERVLNISDTQLVVVAGDGAPGAGNVSYTMNTGARVASGLRGAYLEPSAILDVVPRVGHEGTFVNISTERGLGGGSRIVSVTLAGQPAEVVLGDRNDTVRVRARGNGPLVGEVVVTADTGARAVDTVGFTFLAPGVIAASVPSSGQSNTRVSLVGTNLLGGGSRAARVLLNGVASSVLDSNTTVVVVRFPGGGAGQGDVVIESDTGSLVRLTDGWTTLTDGAVSAVVPAQGQFRTRVSLVGTNLLAGSVVQAVTVTLAGVPATVLSATDTLIVVQAEASLARQGRVLVEAADTEGRVLSADNFTYVAPGAILQVDPTVAQKNALVTIVGSGLRGGSARVTRVVLAGIEARVLNESDTVVTVVAGGTDTTVVNGTVEVFGADGSLVEQPASFTYVAPGVILAVDPAVGQAGTLVRISGTDMLSGSTGLPSVLLGTTPARVLNFTDEEIVVVAAAAAAANGVNVTVIAGNGADVVGIGLWTYAVPPSIDTVDPDSGHVGAEVRIGGSALLGGGSSVRAVLFGNRSALVFGGNDSVVTAVAPLAPGSAAPVPLTVVADTGATVVGGAWTFTEPGVVLSVSPSQGQVGTRIDVVGARLLGATGAGFRSVLLGTVAPELPLANATFLRLRAASRAPGSADLLIVADSGERTLLAAAFTYLVASQLLSAEPARGQLGTRVTLRGERLLGGGSRIAQVLLGGVPATIVGTGNDTEVVVVSGNGPLNVSQSIELESDTGAATALGAAWTYIAPSSIALVAPAFGMFGTRVTIFGQRLLAETSGVPTVVLAGERATVLDFNDTRIVVSAGAFGGNKTGNVVVAAVSGSLATLADAFEYRAPGTVLAASPPAGQRGTLIVFDGTNLQGHGNRLVNATINGVAARIESQNNSHVVVVAPGQIGLVLGSVPVEFTADSGAVVRTTWEYVAEGLIISLLPPQGMEGTRVAVTGLNLCGSGTRVASATVAGIAAQVLAGGTCTTVTLRVPFVALNASLTGVVQLVSDSGAKVDQGASAFTLLVPGVVETITPSAGVASTLVTLAGRNMLGGDTSVVVLLNNTQAAVQSASDVAIVVQVGFGSGQGPVSVTTLNGGVVRNTLQFAYSRIDTVDPSSGQTGTRVSVRGLRLLGDSASLAQATVCGIPAQVVNASESVVVLDIPSPDTIVPPLVCDVELRAPEHGIVVVGRSKFQYLVPGVIQFVSNDDRLHEGANVSIVGQRLLGGGSALRSLALAGVPVARVIHVSDTRIDVVADARANATTGDVAIVSETGARVTLVDGVSYVPQAVILNLSRSTGTNGTTVAILGRGLLMGDAVLTVTLADLAGAVVFESDTNITVVAPGAPERPGDVVITATSGAFVELVNGWTFGAPASIDAVEPPVGFTGNLITIRGQELRGHAEHVVRVLLAGVPAARIVSENNTVVVVEAGRPADPFALLPGRVVVISNSGARVTKPDADAFTYQKAGNIVGVFPLRAREGSIVTLAGEDLLGGGALQTVAVGPISAEILNASETEVVVRLPAAAAAAPAGLSDIVLSSSSGSVVLEALGIDVRPPGNVSSVDPPRLQADARVTIRGTDLLGGAADVRELRLAGVLVGAVVSATEEEVVAIAGPRETAASGGRVELVGDTGALLNVSGLVNYVARAVLALDPSIGQEGTVVTVRGSDLLAGGANVTSFVLGGVALTPVNVSDTAIVVVLPDVPAAAGVGLEYVVETGARVAAAGVFEYAALGQVANVTPPFGAEGTLVTIRGARLTGSSVLPLRSVTVGGVPATVVATSPDVVVVTLGARAAGGIADVVLLSESGARVVGVDQFTYVARGVVRTVVPAQATFGTVVTISGDRLLGGGARLASATLGGFPATVVRETDSEVVVVATEGAGANASVELVADIGAVVSANTSALSYVARGVVASVSPSSGREGTRVVITGSNLRSGSPRVARVILGGADAVILNETATRVEVVAGAGFDGTNAVRVIGSEGGESREGAWRFVDSRVDDVEPLVGQQGTIVRIHGEELFGGAGLARVLFGEQEAAVLTPVFDFFVQVAVPPSGAGAVPIRLLATTGAIVRAPFNFTYLAVPAIAAVDPAVGQGGTVVVISGSGLLAGADTIVSVTLAGVPARVINSSDEQVFVEASAADHGVAGDVVLRASTGALVVRSSAFRYAIAGRIEIVTPGSGVEGTRVVVRGFNLFGQSAGIQRVTLGGVTAQVVGASNSEVRLIAADGDAGRGDILIYTRSGAAILAGDA